MQGKTNSKTRTLNSDGSDEGSDGDTAGFGAARIALVFVCLLFLFGRLHPFAARVG